MIYRHGKTKNDVSDYASREEGVTLLSNRPRKMLHKRVQMQLYGPDGSWISDTDFDLDPDMPISDAAREQILAELEEIISVVSIQPRMKRPGGWPDK